MAGRSAGGRAEAERGFFDVFYIWADNLGTPRLITDSANRSRWEWPNADPFGNNPPNEDPAGLGAFSYNLRFPGQYYDAEKGSNYNYFRDYDPGATTVHAHKGRSRLRVSIQPASIPAATFAWRCPQNRCPS